MKILAWVYVAIFSLVVIFTIVMAAIAQDFSGALESLLILLAPIALGIFILRRRASLILLSVAAVTVLMPISDAHKFWSRPSITLGIYALFVPMLITLIIAGWQSVQNKAT